MARDKELCNINWYDKPCAEGECRGIDEALAIVNNLPSAQQDCTECEDYDSETKSCPKYCDVIRRTLEEAKQERTGKWLPDNRPGGGFWVCSCCKFPSEAFAANKLYKYCPVCGTRMEGVV